MRHTAVHLIFVAIVIAGCSSDPTPLSDRLDVGATDPQPSAPAEDTSTETEPEPTVSLPDDDLYPTVVGATAASSDGTTWRFDVTLSSPYDSPTRYADAWRVLDADDNELGIRVLLHDHAGEQPFTRSHTMEIPAGTATVFVEGRDQLNGWSGERFELTLDS